ncbi:hypothetical protein, partial [Mesonia mobilis]|uniref:hypothetical protein n=1 Tax=Mesonia mobilis TaxID=369791 RepID=UPI0026E9789D
MFFLKVEEDREPELCSINLNADLHNLYNKLDTFFEKGFEYECSQIRFKSASEYHGGSRYTSQSAEQEFLVDSIVHKFYSGEYDKYIQNLPVKDVDDY